MFDKIEAGGCEPPSKQFWAPVTFGTEMTFYGQYPVARLDDLNDVGYVSFYVPDDFHSIVEAMVVVIARWTGTDLWLAASSDYGKHGEAYNTHGSSAWTHEFAVVADNIYEDTIADILADLAAGDYVGICLENKDARYDSDFLGVMFKYD